MSFELNGAVALLTLNRPGKLNALSNELLGAIVGRLDRIELDPAVRAVVITGSRRAFSARADIAAFQHHMRAGPAEAVAHSMRPGHRMTRRVESFPKPVIAAVNGLAFGGGCELVESTHLGLARRAPEGQQGQTDVLRGGRSFGSELHWHPVLRIYITPLTTSRTSTVRLLPPLLTGGISAPINPHSSPVRSLG